VAARTDIACCLRGVGLSFGGVAALRDIDLDIPAGQTVALVGPSGAGKTSLLRVLAGLTEPDTGDVVLHGRRVAEIRTAADRPDVVGMMHQQLGLVPQLSVKHNVQAGMLGRWSLARSLAALFLPLEHPAARRAVARVGLEARLYDRVGLLSGGEQQRVAFARLLVQDPWILLADEPISSLDPALSDDLLGLVTGMAGHGGRSVVVSLHEPAFALRRFERIVAMRGGRIVFDRPADAVTREALDDVYAMGAPAERGTPGPRRDVEPCT
jgi:phosphonate transport system ATP-binding protein